MKLTAVHQKAIALLLVPGIKKAEVARALKVKPSQLSNWLADEDFAAEHEQAQRRLQSQVIDDIGAEMSALLRKSFTAANEMLDKEEVFVGEDRAERRFVYAAGPAPLVSLIRTIWAKQLPDRVPEDADGNTEASAPKVVRIDPGETVGAMERLLTKAAE